MNNSEGKGLDERTYYLNKFIGLGFVVIGIYGLVYAYKTFKNSK
jgi:hypothetical protein